MDNIAPATNIDAKDLPAGFTNADPNAAAAAGGGPAATNSEAQQKEEQKQAILQQALTPDALARLRRIKVCK